MNLLDKAIQIMGHNVIVSNPDQTWMTTQPFEDIMASLGAQTIGYDLDFLESEASEGFGYHTELNFTVLESLTQPHWKLLTGSAWLNTACRLFTATAWVTLHLTDLFDYKRLLECPVHLYFSLSKLVGSQKLICVLFDENNTFAERINPCGDCGILA